MITLLDVMGFLILSLIVSCVYLSSLFHQKLSWIFNLIGLLNCLFFAQIEAQNISKKWM